MPEWVVISCATAIALVAAAALFFSGTVPTRQPGSAVQAERGPPDVDPAVA